MLQKSLVKALQIIDCLCGDKEDFGISEISKELNLNKSNVYDIMTTFEHFGYIKKDPKSRRYSLSIRFLEIAHKVSAQFTCQAKARDVINKISDEIGEVVYFGIPNGDKVMYLEGAFPHQSVSAKPVIGMTAPLTCTGIGKALLANYSEEDAAKVLSKPLIAYTDNTITDPVLLKEELRRIKQRGYSIDNMEHEFGIKCVAVPVFNLSNHLEGALSITGPSLRFPDELVLKYAQILKNAANVIGGRV